jgi:hypothetical protein
MPVAEGTSCRGLAKTCIAGLAVWNPTKSGISRDAMMHNIYFVSRACSDFAGVMASRLHSELLPHHPS